MLFEKLDQICSRIDSLDIKREAEAFAKEMLRNNSQKERKEGPPNDEQILVSMETLAMLALANIKGIPAKIRTLRELVDDPKTPGAMRTTILSALAYVVQPRDIVPDDAPGGYGYLDDLIIVLAILTEVGRAKKWPQEQLKKLEGGLTAFSRYLAPDKLKEVQAAVNFVATLFQLMEKVPKALLAMTDKAIIANPLGAATPAMPAGFTPVPTYQLSDRDAHVTQLPGGGSILSEPGHTSISFGNGGGAALVGKDVVVW
jgi:uncharacterized membrane protein YkvA (DUF1232 family)